MNDAHPAVHDATCRNCAAVLTGPYCARCGQHAHESARSLHVLFHDVWHLMTHLDGRLWGTLAMLITKPGRLTTEYFADHRAGYVPPFRLYFVISVAFFGLAALTSSLSHLHVNSSGKMTAADRAAMQKDLHESGTPAIVTTTVEAATGNGITPELAAQLCEHLGIGLPWADLRLQTVCKHQVADQGKSMMHELGSLVPKMMFVFLPLMALVMLALYHSPPRYYVEHLVFLLHLQSNLFLVMILAMLLGRVADALPVLAPVDSLLGPVLNLYALWYFYSALRHYYGQNSFDTLAKFVGVFFAYLVCLSLSLGATLVLSALVT